MYNFIDILYHEEFLGAHLQSSGVKKCPDSNLSVSQVYWWCHQQRTRRAGDLGAPSRDGPEWVSHLVVMIRRLCFCPAWDLTRQLLQSQVDLLQTSPVILSVLQKKQQAEKRRFSSSQEEKRSSFKQRRLSDTAEEQQEVSAHAQVNSVTPLSHLCTNQVSSLSSRWSLKVSKMFCCYCFCCNIIIIIIIINTICVCIFSLTPLSRLTGGHHRRRKKQEGATSRLPPCSNTIQRFLRSSGTLLVSDWLHSSPSHSDWFIT